MKNLLLLLVLVPFLALGQSMGLNTGTTGKTLASFPLTTSGPLIPDDAGTVSHVVFNQNITNYVLQSNSMSTGSSVTSPWSANTTTIATVAGVDAAYGGGTWMEATTTAATGYVYQPISNGTLPSSTLLAASAWVSKASGSGYASVWTGCSQDVSVAKVACSCLRSDGGVCSAITPVGNYCAAEVSDLGTTPVRLTAIATCSSAVTGAHFLVSAGRYGTSTGTTRFTGAQLEVGTLTPNTLVPTLTAVVSTRPRNTNYALQSNTMSSGASFTAPWTAFHATVATVAGAPAYAGGGSWAEITGDGTADGNAYAAATTTSTNSWVASAWMAKSSGSGPASVYLQCPSGNVSACDCSRSDGGSCSAVTRAAIQCSAEVADLGTTPVRVSAKATCVSSGTTPTIGVVPQERAVAVGRTTRFTGAQLEVGTAAASDLIPTTSTAVTMDRALSDIATNQVDTNWILYSQDFGNAAWFPMDSAARPTADTAVAPDGTTTAETYASDTTSSVHGMYQSMTYVDGVATISAYFKAGTASCVTLGLKNTASIAATVNLNTSTITAQTADATSATATSVGNGWTRLSVTGVMTAGVNYPEFWLPQDCNTYTRDAWTPGAPQTVSVWGAQVERVAFANTYVPTTTAAASATHPRTTVPMNYWTLNGTVPQVSANPFTTTRYGAGPFSTSNYYSLGTGNDVLDFAGDFMGCAVFTVGTTGTEYILSNGTANVAGYYLSTGGGYINFALNGSGVNYNSSAQNVIVGGPNVACFGRNGSGANAMVNLLAGTPTAAASPLNGTSIPARIGVSSTPGSPVLGQVHEVWLSSTPYSAALATQIQQKVLGHYDGTSPLSVTRANSTATYLNGSCNGTDQCLWTAPANVARITTDGLLVEPQRVNYALQSNTISTGTGVTAPWLLANATVTTPAGTTPFTGTWAEVTNTTNTGNAYINTATVASTTTLVGSAWAAMPSGTGYASVWAGCGSAILSACSCLRSDGGSCTTGTVASRYCQAKVSDLTTTPVRISAIVTCSAATTAGDIVVHAGNYNVATGTTRFTGAQLEVGTYPTSLIVTQGTSASRSSDQISATVPAVPSNWCVATTAKPEEGRAWSPGGYQVLWGIGTQGAANTASLFAQPTNNGMDFETFDATPTQRYGRTSALTFAAGTGHRFVACDNLGTISLSFDGASQSLTMVGAGTGIIAGGTTLRIGNRSDGYEFGGYLKNLKLCAASNAKGCK